MKRLALLLTFAIMLLSASPNVAGAGTSDDYSIDANLLSSGAQSASSADYAVESTVGQPAAGQGDSADYSVCSGACQLESALAQFFLPLIQRSGQNLPGF